jgi:hypothetical protein
MKRSVRLFSTLLAPLAAVACTGGGSPSANYTPSPSYASQPQPSYSTAQAAPAQPYTPPQFKPQPYVPPAATPPPAYTPPAYTPPAYTPPAYTPPPAPVNTYTPPAAAPAYSSSFGWARSLSEAQSLARASNRLIFLESGRESCGNCQKLKKTLVPEMSSELGRVAVGYYDDCDVDKFSQVFMLLHANLPNAATLPLVGFVTPDLQWVTGFSGGTDAGRFRSEIDRASAGRRSGAVETGDTAKPSFGALPGAFPASGPSSRALASLRSLPDAELADIGPELVADADLDPSASVPAPTIATAASRTETATTDERDVRSWARDELARAAAALAARDYARARVIIATVREKAQGNPEAREADKGEVAIYNLRKIESTPDDADSLRVRARHDLLHTVWAPLFA